MTTHSSPAAKWALWLTVGVISLLTGCYVGFWGTSEHWSTADSALGEEHEINFPVHDAYLLTQDALRGDGILFEVGPDNSLITLWRNADTKVGFMQNMMGVQPRYRYEIQVIPEGSQKSKVVVNVHTEGIPDSQIADYKASKRFALFGEIDELAAKYPPPSSTPASGGVNFTLLPNEDLKALARRVTGSEDNWRQIAKDNSLGSPTEVTPFQSIWVANNLIKRAPEKAHSAE
ncbi:MAG TPA: hypothetical protein VFE43_00770 [Candidatus Binataceae bacterium]|jgi:hypothetical protein|nr:hypothetical protein [Candidatus Binataceae bacterium]